MNVQLQSSCCAHSVLCAVLCAVPTVPTVCCAHSPCSPLNHHCAGCSGCTGCTGANVNQPENIYIIQNPQKLKCIMTKEGMMDGDDDHCQLQDLQFCKMYFFISIKSHLCPCIIFVKFFFFFSNTIILNISKAF